MRITRRLSILFAAACLGLVGCGALESEPDNAPPLVTDTDPYEPQTVYTASVNSGQGPEQVDPTTEDTAPLVITDAMVGQINGKPIYASAIFAELGEESLTRLGQEQPRNRFIQEVASSVKDLLEARVTNTLIVAEAEADLTAQERAQMQAVLVKEREKVVAKYLGVPARAQEALIAEGYPRGLDDYVEELRQQMLVGQYRMSNISPKVHVTRQQIERYYQDHIDEYVESGQVTLRLIRVDDDDTADIVENALNAGEPFADVAERHTVYSRGTGGRRDFTDNMETFDSLADEFDAAVQQLAVGEHSARIVTNDQYWWIYLEAYEPGNSRSLQDVYLEIEGKLRQQRETALFVQHIARMRNDGNYTPVNEMVITITEIAVNRYAHLN